MRLLLATLAAASVAVLALGALVTMNLQAFVEVHGDELRTRAERLLERPITIGDITPSWWPLGIRLATVTIAEDPRFGTRPFLEAEAVRIRVHPWRLAGGQVEVAGFVLDRPRVSFVRDANGRWNVASLGSGDERADGNRERGRRRRGPRVPVEWLVGMALSEIRDGRVDVEDLTGATPRHLTAGRLRLRAENVRLGAEARVRAEAAVFPGSTRPDAHIDLRLSNLGVNDTEHSPFHAEIELRDLDLATAAALTGTTSAVTGRVSSVTADVTGTLEGFVTSLKARTEGNPLRIGKRFALPAVPASLEARVIRDGERVTLEDGRGKIGGLGFTATGNADLDPWRAQVSLQSREGAVDVALGEPPLRLHDVALTLTLEPGVVHIDPARFGLDDGSVDLTADVTGLDPPALASRFQARAFGGVLEGTVDPSDDGSLALHVKARGVDAGVVGARLLSESLEHVSGGVDGELVLSVPVGDGAGLDALTGSGTFTLTDATLRDVNMAEHVLGHVREVGLVPRLLSARTRARYPEIFDARHTVITGATAAFRVGEGRCETELLTVKTAPYEVTGSGWVDFDGLVRFSGDLVLSRALSATLRADVPAVKYLSDEPGHVSVPFRLRGPLGVARPEPDLKRLRKRGLELLRDTRRDRRDDRAGRDDKREMARDDDPSAPVIENLERMLRP